MDNLTHCLVGVMMSRAGTKRWVPHASVLMVLAANMPDCDVISAAGGAASYLDYHRGITHSIAATPAVALLPLLVVRAVYWKQPMQWLRSWIASMAGVASHWLLDYTNPYGVRLLLPFSDVFPSLDITSVVDIWIWAVLLIAFGAPALSRLISSEIGDKATPGRGWAIFALATILCYDTARWFLHERSVAVQSAHLYNGQAPRNIFSFPSRSNPMVWTGIVETEQAWFISDVDLRQEFAPSTARTLYKTNSPAVDVALTSPAFMALRRFSKSLQWQATPASDGEGATQVDAVDLRFGFRASGVVTSDGKVRESGLRF